MPFASEFVERAAKEEEVEVETGRPSGRTSRTIVWVVVDGGRVYLRSVRGARGRWYQRIKADPIGALHVAGQRAPVRAVAVDDPAEVERVSEALRRKYARSSSLESMLRPETLPTTLRLDPL